ncbi:MAG: hypothetical protein ABJH45_15250 [Paracoccaceae bacterium]
MMKRTLTLIAAAATSIAISTQASTAASNLPQNIGSAGYVSTSSDVQFELVGYKFHNGHGKGRHGFKRTQRVRSGHKYQSNHHNGHKVNHGHKVHHGQKAHHGHKGHGASSKHHELSSKEKKVLILKKLFN